jgi:quinol monooxygenase YgiN
MTPRLALHVSLKARAGKSEELAAFLSRAQPLAEAEGGTLTWYAARLSADHFVIFDTFADDAGRQAHLSGPIAAALMAHAEELLSEAPDIQFADVLAHK